MGTWVSQTGQYPLVFVIEDAVDCVRDSFCKSPEKSIRQTSNDIPFRSNTSLYTHMTDLNFINQINGDRYRAMITNFFIPELNNHDVQELWFQQDGATCHTARATIDLLKDTFGDRLISPFVPVNWPPRPCDLTPLDYFLWG
ncbi:hypothetical protein TNCV_4480811 [Trichonephila clavipes]|nr:hypothetical protein TNCV_4480811 [Trichonephila clavipes]